MYERRRKEALLSKHGNAEHHTESENAHDCLKDFRGLVRTNGEEEEQ